MHFVIHIYIFNKLIFLKNKSKFLVYLKGLVLELDRIVLICGIGCGIPNVSF